MKKIALIALIGLTCLLLVGCQKQAANITHAPIGIATQAPAMEVSETPATDLPSLKDQLPPGYDPASEEAPESLLANQNPQTEMAAHAGATAIPIDPVDLPTPTPRPPLAFTYAKYTSSALGLSFESVAGYEIDESQPNTYILREPVTSIKDNYQVQITISLTPVTNNFKSQDAKQELSAKLKDLGTINYTQWDLTTTNSRTLLGKPGYYANYRGVLFDGTIVRGRVHMALVDGKLLTLHVTCPGWYNTDYMDVYARIRSTLKQN
ncbi:MAG: hypothetical protein ACOX6G_06325 [Christensenellales bacterium]|jgi:hypothetical protein|nr:hypothetical protein [Clostridiales bacterium]